MTLRRKVWLIASGGKALLEQCGQIYEQACRALERNRGIRVFTEEEVFGGSIGLLRFLPESLLPTIRQFLTVVWSNNHGVRYSPLIPTISILLLLFMEPSLAYISIQAMINRSREDGWYFTIDKKQFQNSVLATEKLVCKKVADVSKHASELELNIAYITLTLMPAFFLPFMPIPVALTILDSFLVEGRKILTRFIITLFKRSRDKLLATKTKEQFIYEIVNEMDRLSQVSELNSFLRDSFKIYLARKPHMIQLEMEASSDLKSIQNLNRGAAAISDILTKLPQTVQNPLSFPRGNGTSFLSEALMATTPEEMQKHHNEMQEIFMQRALPTVQEGILFTNSMLYSIRDFLPRLYQRQSLELVYRMSRDGTSFQAFKSAAVVPVPHILVIKSESGIIGAFLSDPPNPALRRQASERYFGTSSMFVFKANEMATCYKLKEPPNKSFIAIDRDTIMVGGPEPAILLMRSFSLVISKDCPTYGSPPLIDNPEGEKVLDIELFQMTIHYSALSVKQ